MRSIKKSLTAGLASLAMVANPMLAQTQDAQSDEGISRFVTEENIGKAVGAAAGALLGSQVGEGKGKLAAVALGTLAGFWLGGEVGKRLTQRDQVGIAETTQVALDTGRTQTWKNPETGVYTRVSVDAPSGPDVRQARVRSTLDEVPPLEMINAYYTATSTVNMRSGPGTEYRVVRQVREGEQVPVVGKVIGSDWYLIAEGGVGNGFIYGPVLTRSRSQPESDNAIRGAMDRGDRPRQYVADMDQCRDITQEVVLPDGTSREHTFTACRQPDGSWVEV